MEDDEEVQQQEVPQDAPQEEQAQPQAAEVKVILAYLRVGREIQAYVLIKDRFFAHTKDLDPDLLESTGMNVDFANIWHAIGCDAFVPILEEGSHSLTIHFLCTLQYNDDGLSFHLLRQEYMRTWKEMSLLLDFHKKCKIDFDKAVRDYDHHSFQTSISSQVLVSNSNITAMIFIILL
jgi:hypothetical protein